MWREDLAALVGEVTSDARLVMLQARAALLYAGDVARCEARLAIQREILALPEGRRRVARTMSCVLAAEKACAALCIALPSERAGRKEWRATVKAAVWCLTTIRLEERPILALFRTCEPAADWLRRWVSDIPATREAPPALIVSLLGGCCRLLPVTRLVRFAHDGQERPHFFAVSTRVV